MILCTAATVHAQPQVSPELKAFVTEYVAAYDAKDAPRLLALYAAKSRACINAETKDFYDGTLEMMWQTPIPAKYTFTVTPVDESNLKAVEAFGRFPDHPSRELHIDYQQGDDSGTVIVYLMQENARWRADQPCATEQTLKQFRDEAPERKARDAHFKALADGIQEPLRASLIELVRAHKTAAAIERYKDASGQDRQTAMLVINQLALQVTR